MTLMDYLRSQGAKQASKVNGPNGAFISVRYNDDSSQTIPVGKKSQSGTLQEFQAFQTEDGNIIATINLYQEEESVDL